MEYLITQTRLPGMDKYDPDYFRAFFGAIPEEQWCTGQLSCERRGFNRPAKCALGHLGVEDPINNEEYVMTPAAIALDKMLAPLTKRYHGEYPGDGLSVVAVNDSPSLSLGYNGPKERILAALDKVERLAKGRL
jgi:hypothetical protein